MSVTIKDVAALAGVSASTVSRVCNGTAATSRETRERVLQAAARLGYEIGPAVEPRPGGTGKTIAVILPPANWETCETGFCMKAIQGIGKVCNQKQATSIVVTGNDPQELLQAVRSLHQQGQAEGYILLYSQQNDPVARYLGAAGVPFVVVGKVDEAAVRTVCVDNDNLMAGKDAADYLFRLGHRRIGCVSGKNDYLYTADRQSGYHLSLMRNGLPILPEYSVEIGNIQEKDLRRLRLLLKREDRPTAFVVCDDLLALILERVCMQMGLRIPEDISVIAFNNSLYSQLVTPQLTVVEINAGVLGSEAAGQLLKRMKNPSLPVTKTVIPHKILQRGSCRPHEEEQEEI